MNNFSSISLILLSFLIGLGSCIPATWADNLSVNSIEKRFKKIEENNEKRFIEIEARFKEMENKIEKIIEHLSAPKNVWSIDRYQHKLRHSITETNQVVKKEVPVINKEMRSVIKAGLAKLGNHEHNTTVEDILGNSFQPATGNGYPPMSDKTPECLDIGKKYVGYGIDIEGCKVRTDLFTSQTSKIVYWRVMTCGGWTTQKLRCFLGGGQLASFISNSDRMFLSNYYVNNEMIESITPCGWDFTYDVKATWIGLTGTFGQNNWKWENGETQDNKYLPWNRFSTYFETSQKANDGNCALAAYTPYEASISESESGFRQADCNTQAIGICMKVIQ